MALTLNKIKRIRKAASQGLYVGDIDIMELCDLAVLAFNPSPEVERLVALANHITDALGPYRDLNGHAVVYEANAALTAYKEAQRLALGKF